jgi:hypothetical protein
VPKLTLNKGNLFFAAEEEDFSACTHWVDFGTSGLARIYTIMTRSIESIRKRAEKRGRTLEEQLKAEAASSFNMGTNVALAHASPTPRHVASEGRATLNQNAEMEAKLKLGWDCGPCNNRNFEERVECFRCRRVKPRPTLNIPAAPSLKRTDRNEEAKEDAANTDETEEKEEGKEKQQKESDSGWGAAASSERLQSNEYLRQLCVSIEGPTTTTTTATTMTNMTTSSKYTCSGAASEELVAAWSALSSAEQERGRLLVARSQRKKAAKATGAAKKRTTRAIGNNNNKSVRRAERGERGKMVMC